MSGRLLRLWERFGPRARDLVFVLAALLAAFAETMARRDRAVLEWTAVGAAGLVGALAVWWRRTHPAAVTLIGLGTFAVTSLPVVLFVALFTLATRRRDRVLATLAAASLVALAVRWSFETDDSWARTVLWATLVVGFVVAAGAYVGARQDLLTALRERAERAESERDARADQARMAERARIAREMHDVLAHKVSLIAMHAGALEVQTAPSPEQIAASAGLIRATAGEAMEDLREVLGVLRTDASDAVSPPPRAADIARLVESSRAAGVHAELQVSVPALPDAVARTVHRIVLEGLTNVHKHARGAATIVRITGGEADGVRVAVVNERPAGGPVLLPGAGAGLLGLRERLDLLGGTLRSGPRPDGGWCLAAWLPWSPS